MAQMFIVPQWPIRNSAGSNLATAKIWFTVSGGNTPATIYANNALSVPRSNPITMDAAGKFPTVYLDPDVDYRVRVYAGTATLGVTAPIEEYDPYKLGVSHDDVAGLEIEQAYATDDFFAADGAQVDRLNSRVLVGNSTLNTAEDDEAQSDWPSQYEMAKGRAGGSTQRSIVAISNNEYPQQQQALFAAFRTIYAPHFYNGCPLRLLGVNNSPHADVHVYGAYVEAFREIGAAGGAYGVEIDNMNYAGVAAIDPYQQAAGQTIGLQLAAGAELSSTGQFSISAAINIRKNGADYVNGIVFGNDALAGANGTTGTAVAIAFAKGHEIGWYGAASTPTSKIRGTGTTLAKATIMDFADDAVTFRNASSTKIYFSIGNLGTSTVNYPYVQGAPTGAPVQLLAGGDDTNVGIQFVPKGTGRLSTPLASLPNYANDAAAAAGGLAVGDWYRNGSVLMIRAA